MDMQTNRRNGKVLKIVSKRQTIIMPAKKMVRTLLMHRLHNGGMQLKGVIDDKIRIERRRMQIFDSLKDRKIGLNGVGSADLKGRAAFGQHYSFFIKIISQILYSQNTRERNKLID